MAKKIGSIKTTTTTTTKGESTMETRLMIEAPHPKVMAMYEYEKYTPVKNLGLLKKVDVLEYRNGTFTKVDEQELAGVQAMLPGAFVVRIWTDVEDKGGMIAAQLNMETRVKEELPDARLMPSHPGWINRTVVGTAYVHALFSLQEYNDAANMANSRLTRLIGHLDWRSRYLGQFKVQVLRTKLFSKYDGWYLVRPGLVKMPWNAIKMYGSTNVGPGYVDGGAPTVKGVGESNARLWKLACNELNIAYDAADVIIPEISLKFDDNADTFTADLFSVFNSVIGEHFTITLQMLMNLPLTDEAHAWVARKVVEKLDRIRKGLEDGSGLAVAKMLAEDSDTLAQFLGDDYCDSDVEEARETISATLSRIVAGLPMENSKYLKAVLPGLFRLMKRLTIRGGSETVLPDGDLKPFEITISRTLARVIRRQGIDVRNGMQLLVARHPQTSSECALCTVVEIGGRTAVNPEWWADRFKGDFDGDRIAVGCIIEEGLSSFVDESRVIVVTPMESPKGELTVAQANAAGWYSQAMIPTADRYLRIANERGLDVAFFVDALTKMIDSSKHNYIVDLKAIAAKGGISENESPSSLALIMSGSLGRKSACLMKYNVLVSDAKKQTTRIKWMNMVAKSGALFNVFSGTGDPDYATMITDLTKRSVTRGYNYDLAVSYIESLGECGLKDEFFGVSKNHEPQAVIPAELLTSKAALAARSKAEATPQIQKIMARRCLVDYQAFIKAISSGTVSTTRAYQPVRDAVTMLKESPLGAGALKWLFSSLVFGLDPQIRMKATVVLSYMPLKLGDYNVVKMMQYLGYERKFNIITR